VSEADSVTTENRRLQREVRALRERVAALESSRWWRVHPRFLARRLAQLVPSRRTEDEAVAETPPEPATQPAHPLAARFRDEVVAHGDFSKDWFSGNVATWEPVARELEGRSAQLLEIGSFEGLSACFLLWRLPDAQVTCIDTFEGSVEHEAYGVEVATLEERFDRNVARFGGSRVRKLVGDSRDLLPRLLAEGRQFDLVYVDGSHNGLDVVIDASFGWRLLAPGGVMIFDDYTWAALGPDPMLRPGAAIDAFLGLVAEHCDVLFSGRQVAARKRD
jgi:predicted O-methyltransferase YrrM